MLNSRKILGRMRELGITQKCVSDHLGLAASTVSQKINGVRPMSLDEAEKLAALIQIRPSEFGTYFFTS